MKCGYILLFKQKTAYERRISDWSSDVCSSDLAGVLIGSPVYGILPTDGVLRCIGVRQARRAAKILHPGRFAMVHPRLRPNTGATFLRFALRSEERRLGQECFSMCSSRWLTYH